MYNVYDGTSRRLSDASSSDPSIRSWTATKWLGSDFCLPQVLEGGSYEPNEPPLRTGLGIEDECSRNSHLQYINSANRSPCDVIKKMADFQEDGNRKLQIFAYLHVGVTTLSITIGLYSLYCFIYRNKNFACQWHFKFLPAMQVFIGMLKCK